MIHYLGKVEPETARVYRYSSLCGAAFVTIFDDTRQIGLDQYAKGIQYFGPDGEINKLVFWNHDGQTECPECNLLHMHRMIEHDHNTAIPSVPAKST